MKNHEFLFTSHHMILLKLWNCSFIRLSLQIIRFSGALYAPNGSPLVLERGGGKARITVQTVAAKLLGWLHRINPKNKQRTLQQVHRR